MTSHFAKRFSWILNENESFRHLYFGCNSSSFAIVSEEEPKIDIEYNPAHSIYAAELEICLWLDHIKNVLMLRHIDQSLGNTKSFGLLSRTYLSYKRIDSKNGTGVIFEFPNKSLPKSFLSIVEAADWLQNEVRNELTNW